jgi:hypothetical protein
MPMFYEVHPRKWRDIDVGEAHSVVQKQLFCICMPTESTLARNGH